MALERLKVLYVISALAYNQTWSGFDDPLQRYGQVHEMAVILDANLEFLKMIKN